MTRKKNKKNREEIKMTTMDIMELMRELLEIEGLEVTTYEEEGLLSWDEGLVVKTEDGSEFQITIVQSRWGE